MGGKRIKGLIWVLGGIAFGLAAVRGRFMLRANAVQALASGADWHQGGFQPGAVYPSTALGALPRGIVTVGSWVGSDQWQGSAQTVWLAAIPGKISVFVAGYPQVPGCRLAVEIADGFGRFSTLVCDLPDPGEIWQEWVISLPAGAVRYRLVAADRNTAARGWLGFSAPLRRLHPGWVADYETAQVLCTFCLGIVLLLFPGFIAARFFPPGIGRSVSLLGAGPIGLAAIGLLAWLFGGWLQPVVFGETGAFVVWLGAAMALRGLGAGFAPSKAESTVVAVMVLAAFAGVAKASYSGGPENELFRGMVQRTLAVGTRSDCITPYRVAQVVARDLSPFSPASAAYFAPWSFFSRGPLAGLAAAPLIFATGKPPALLDNAWEPFDPWGYGSYRIALAILSSGLILATFLILRDFVAEKQAAMAATAAALCPFVLHEIVFTWPKLVATVWILLSFQAAHHRRPWLAGLLLTTAYFFHPMALLWSPVIAVWVVYRRREGRAAGLRSGLKFFLPLLVAMGLWMAASEICRRLSGSVQASQTLFFQYFFWADGFAAHFGFWLHTRWMNFANTFLPFWLHFFDESHPDLNSVYGPSSPVVKFAFSWWNTLPLGMGLMLWGYCTVRIARGLRGNLKTVTLLLLFPALFLTIYWGDKSTGLMRECGHPLIPTYIGLAAVQAGWRILPFLQLPEALLMFWLTTLANPHPLPSPWGGFDPAWLTLNVLCLLGIAWLGAGCRSLPD